MLGIIVGHLGKRPHDPGAVFDLDGDGVVEPGETEAIRNLQLAAAILEGHLEHGGRGLVLADGTYQDRVARAALAGATLILHVHHDSGHGGMLLHDHRSSPGRGTAARLSRAITAQHYACRPEPAWDDRTDPSDTTEEQREERLKLAWRYRSYGLLTPIYPLARAHGLVLEVATIRHTLDYTRQLGLAIGRALEI